MFINNLNSVQSIKSYEINDNKSKKDLTKDEPEKKKYKKNKKKYKSSETGSRLDTKV